MGKHRLSIGTIDFAIYLHDMDTGCSHIINVQELTHWLATAPDCNFFHRILYRIVETTQQRRNNMAVIRVVVIVWAIQVGRHHAAIITTMLTVVTLTQLDPSNLGNRVGFIG